MPITHSAKKAIRQSKRRAAENKTRQDALKTVIKKYRRLVASKNTKEATELLPKIFKIADKTAKTKTIKKNKARRIKSRLSKLISESK